MEVSFGGGGRSFRLELQTYVHSFSMDKELFRSVIASFVYVSLRAFMRILNLELGCHWWFNYSGPLLDVELESTCLSG